MNKLLKYLKKSGIFILSLIIMSLLVSLIYLIGFINSRIVTIFNIIGIIIVTFYLSYKNGQMANKKGYFAGIKVGVTNILILFLINLIFFHLKINFSTIVYYLIILFVSTLGGMIGITKTNQQE